MNTQSKATETITPPDVIDPQLAMIYMCQEIGGIAESNCHYTRLLNRLIKESGKDFQHMTVIEVLRMHRLCNQLFNLGAMQ